MKKVLTYGIAALAAFAGQLAYGHAELSASMPADKAVVAAAPKEVMLHFTEPVRVTALSLQKQGESSKQSLGPLPAGTNKDFMVAAPALSDGQYTVSWRALSDDAHVMTGEFTFAVGAGGAPAQHSEHAQPEQSHSEHAGHSDAHRDN
jgi:methionine-rich copper-binding protein CopC